MNKNEDFTITVSAKKIYDSLKRLEGKSDEMIQHQKKTNGRVTKLEDVVVNHDKCISDIEKDTKANSEAVKDMPTIKTKLLVVWGGAVMLGGIVVKYVADLVLPAF